MQEDDDGGAQKVQGGPGALLDFDFSNVPAALQRLKELERLLGERSDLNWRGL